MITDLSNLSCLKVHNQPRAFNMSLNFMSCILKHFHVSERLQLFLNVLNEGVNSRKSWNSHWANSFHATGLFLYPLEAAENQRFWCFQGVKKKANGLKRVNVVIVSSNHFVVYLIQYPRSWYVLLFLVA